MLRLWYCSRPPVEIWMTLLDAQFYLTICAAIICVSDGGRHRVIRYATLLLACLTGPVSCALTPFFWIKAYQERTRGAKLQAALMTLLSTLQGTILLRSIHSGSRNLDLSGKAEWLGPIFFTKTFLLLLLTRLSVFASQRLLIHHPSFIVAAIMWVLFIFCVILFGKAAWFGGRLGRLFFCMAVVSLLFNYSGDPAPTYTVFTGEFRYFFSGTVLLSLAVLAAYQATLDDAGPVKRRLALLLLLCLTSGLIDATGYWARLQRREPRWTEEVAAWRKNPSHPLRVYPPDWPQEIRLEPR